jgi:hypothetical protein
MIKTHRRYIIVPNTAANRTRAREAIQDGHLTQTALSTVRLSNDGTQAILKWNHTRLARVPDRWRDYITANNIQIYTHAEILALITSDPRWT